MYIFITFKLQIIFQRNVNECNCKTQMFMLNKHSMLDNVCLINAQQLPLSSDAIATFTTL